MSSPTGRRAVAEGLLAVAAVAIALAGCATTVETASTGPSGDGSPTPSIAASATPSQVLPTDPAILPCPQGVPYSAGTHSLPAALSQTIPLTVTMTSGWDGCNPAYKDVAGRTTLMLGFWDVRTILRDPCHWQASLQEPATGPSVDDLVSALSDQELTVTEAPVAATLDGRSATYLRLTVPPGADSGDCDGGTDETNFRIWNGATDTSFWALFADVAPDLVGEVWALDVAGTRVVVQTAWFKGASEADLAELHAIVESVHFTP